MHGNIYRQAHKRPSEVVCCDIRQLYIRHRQHFSLCTLKIVPSDIDLHKIHFKPTAKGMIIVSDAKPDLNALFLIDHIHLRLGHSA